MSNLQELVESKLKNVIVIHLPKTAGTTFISTILNIDWQIPSNYHYRHLNERTLTCGDIFDEEYYNNYKNDKIIIFVRDPFERIISEYNFLKCRKEFMNLFDKRPNNLLEYIENEQTHNSMVNALVGIRLITRVEENIAEQNLLKVLKKKKKLNFLIGKTEDFSNSLNYIIQETQIEINNTINIKRPTIYKEPIENYEELKEIFIKNNKYDYILYNKLEEIYKIQMSKVKIKKEFNIRGDKYSYILNYTTQFSIFEAFNVNKFFIEKYLNVLKEMDRCVKSELSSNCINPGKVYIINWLKLFIKYFKLDQKINLEDPIKTMIDVQNIKENLFIHIPKTGGSTFVNYLQTSLEPHLKRNTDTTHHTKHILNTEIKHINFSHPKRISECFDIFSDDNIVYYKNYNIFSMVRDPIDRLRSEFIFQYHILEGKSNAAIISKLEPMPKTFDEYIKYPQVWNYQVAFLIGKGVADIERPEKADLERVISTCDKLNITLGITEEYDKFINKFQDITKYELRSKMKRMKKSPDDIKKQIIDNLTDETREYILETNNLDYKLYLYAKSQV